MKIAIIGCWHIHLHSYIKEALGIPGVAIAAVWDADPQRGKKWAEELGCPYEAAYERILENPNIDGVLVCAPTAMRAELLLKAAEAGKHIFTEKVLALTIQEAEKIQKAIKKTGVRFAISFPHKTRRDLLLIKKLVEEKALGQITYARVYNSHNGSSADWLLERFYDPKQSGGGAMMELGADGLYLLPWFLGRPQKVQSTFTHVSGRPVEDNAVSVLTFPGGSIGVAETGYVHRYMPMTVEVVGTEGAVFVRTGDPVRLCSQSTGGKWKEIPEDELPIPLPSALRQWVNAVELRMGTLFDIEDAVALTKVMSAAYQSAATGKRIKIEA